MGSSAPCCLPAGAPGSRTGAASAPGTPGQATAGKRPDGTSINETAGSGFFANAQALAARNDPTGYFNDAKGESTTELQNVVFNQALTQLKAAFGAAPTEGERKILLDLQASVDKTPKERETIIKRAIARATQLMTLNQRRSDEIRGGTFYEPRTAAAPLKKLPKIGDIVEGNRFEGGKSYDSNNWKPVQ